MEFFNRKISNSWILILIVLLLLISNMQFFEIYKQLGISERKTHEVKIKKTPKNQIDFEVSKLVSSPSSNQINIDQVDSKKIKEVVTKLFSKDQRIIDNTTIDPSIVDPTKSFLEKIDLSNKTEILIYGVKNDTTDEILYIAKITNEKFNGQLFIQNSNFIVSSISMLNTVDNTTLEQSRIAKNPIFAVIIGNDYRPGVDGKRADSLHVIGYNPQQNASSIINFPRDTKVSIPGHGTNKINSANAYGGSALTALTLSQLMGMTLTITAETDFAGFINSINALGGVSVNVDKIMKDTNSGSNFLPGINLLNGNTALAFSRDRHSFSNGDLSRTFNQAKVLVAIAENFKNIQNSFDLRLKTFNEIRKNVVISGISFYDQLLLLEVIKNVDLTKINIQNAAWTNNASETLAPSAFTLFDNFRTDAII